MLRTIVCFGLAAVAVAASSSVALALRGDSSSWGTEDSGPTVPTQSLTPRDRSWNFDNEPLNRAIAGAEWVREHAGASPYPWPR